jgi:uncharacterized membrane protein YhhN
MLFPGGIEATSNGTLILSVAAAVLYLVIINQRPTPLRSVAKTLAVGLLAALTVVEGGPLLLFLALAASAVGDAFLSRDGDRMFLAGLASFLAAHLCYIGLYLTHGSGLDSLLTAPWRVAVAAAIVVVGLVLFIQIWRRVTPKAALPIFVYTLVGMTSAIAAQTLARPAVSLGALMFFASDALLATERYLISAISPHRAVMRQLVWALYYAGQVAITLGFLL